MQAPADEILEIKVNIQSSPDPFIPLGLGRVRYSRFDAVPKNTLYLLKSQDSYFFGIARCNLKADACVKSVGRVTALQRAVESFTRHKYAPALLHIDTDGLTGHCHQNLLHCIEDYFYGLDRPVD